MVALVIMAKDGVIDIAGVALRGSVGELRRRALGQGTRMSEMRGN